MNLTEKPRPAIEPRLMGPVASTRSALVPPKSTAIFMTLAFAPAENRAAIPADYQTYLELGRFRNALVLYEQTRKPTPALNQFIAGYGLAAFKPPSQHGK